MARKNMDQTLFVAAPQSPRLWLSSTLQKSRYMTVNEARRSLDLQPIAERPQPTLYLKTER